MNILEQFSQSPIYEQFIEHLKKKYPDSFDSFTPTVIQDKFEIIIMMGLTQSKKFLNTKRACNLLYNGHPARADMVARLGNILYELQGLGSYPIVKPMRLGDAIRKVIGTDNRYIKQYRTWITTLSNYQARFDVVDLSWIVSVFPEDLIVQKENW